MVVLVVLEVREVEVVPFLEGQEEEEVQSKVAQVGEFQEYPCLVVLEDEEDLEEPFMEVLVASSCAATQEEAFHIQPSSLAKLPVICVVDTNRWS